MPAPSSTAAWLDIFNLRRMGGLGLAVLLAATAVGCAESASEPAQSDLTIYVAGDLLAHGGVVVVNPLPVAPERWAQVSAAENVSLPPPADLKPIATDGKRMTVTADRQFSDVQFFYPAGREYTFRLRPAPDQRVTPEGRGTQLLSVGGVDMTTGQGAKMAYGFTDMDTSGDQTIHVAAPDTDELSARALVGVVVLGMRTPPMQCVTRSATSVCTPTDAAWPDVTARWETGKAESIYEQKRHVALRKCYDTPPGRGQTQGCELVSPPGADPVYEYKR